MLRDLVLKMIEVQLDEMWLERNQVIQTLSDEAKHLILKVYEARSNSDGLIVICSEDQIGRHGSEELTVLVQGPVDALELGAEYIEAVAEAYYHGLVDYVVRSQTIETDSEGILELRHKGKKIAEMILEEES